MKSMAGLTAALMLAFSLAGCGTGAAAAATREASSQPAQSSQTGTETAQTTVKQETQTQGTASQPAEEKAMGIMGKVTAIDEKTITLNLAQSMTPPAEHKADAGTGQAPASEEKPAGDPKAPPAGEKQAEGTSKIMTMALTGEEKTFTLSGQVHVTKGMGDKQEAIELSQIAAGSIVTLQTETNADGQVTVIAVSLLG
jgi:hypothetical protein